MRLKFNFILVIIGIVGLIFLLSYKIDLNVKNIPNSYGFIKKFIPDFKHQTRYLICVINRNTDFEKRTIIRQLWLNKRLTKRQDYIYKFFIGLPKDNGTRTVVEEEMRLYGDFIVLNSTETYELLMEKTLDVLKWFIDNSNHPSYVNVQYLIKADDDFMVFVDNVLKKLDDFNGEYLGTKVVGQPVNRDNQTRYFVPPSLYNETYYQPYASGACYVIGRNAAFKIYETSLKIAHFRNEDAFLGYLAFKSNINLIDDNRFHTFAQLTDDSIDYVCKSRNLLGIHSSNKINTNRQQLFFYRFMNENIKC